MLAQALATHKQAAYEFAMAIQAIGQSINQSVEEQTRYFAESVMTRQELVRAQRDERDELRKLLPTLTDPQRIEETVARILELNRLLFDALPEEERKKQVEDYTRIADNVGEKAGALLDEALANAAETQDRLNAELDRLLADAATSFQSSAGTMSSAAGNFAIWVNRLLTQGIQVDVNSGGATGGELVF